MTAVAVAWTCLPSVACPITSTAASFPDTSTAEEEHASPWVPITPNDGESMEHMQIVPQFLCHATARSFITPVTSCTPPWAQTMNPSVSSMLLFVFNCQEKENKRPVTRRCKNTAVSCELTWESSPSGRKCCRHPVLRIDLTKSTHTLTRLLPLPLVFRWLSSQSILSLKPKWDYCKVCVLHVERWGRA